MNYKWIYPERDKVNSEIHMFQFFLFPTKKSFQNKILEGGGGYATFIY